MNELVFSDLKIAGQSAHAGACQVNLLLKGIGNVAGWKQGD
jgi:hypothetical protein